MQSRDSSVVPGGQRPTALARVLMVQGAVSVAGGLLLWWFARPLRFDSMSALASISWPMLWVPAFALATLSGICAGTFLRFRWPWWVAAIVLGLTGLLALYPPLFQVGKWPGSTVQETNISDLVAALAGWTLYQAASSGLAAVLARGVARRQ